jgi:hypothetical protein
MHYLKMLFYIHESRYDFLNSQTGKLFKLRKQVSGQLSPIFPELRFVQFDDVLVLNKTAFCKSGFGKVWVRLRHFKRIAAIILTRKREAPAKTIRANIDNQPGSLVRAAVPGVQSAL